MAKKGIEGDAAIIPSHMFSKDEYGFGIENVTDSENNHTRFLVVEPSDSNNKFELNDNIRHVKKNNKSVFLHFSN